MHRLVSGRGERQETNLGYWCIGRAVAELKSAVAELKSELAELKIGGKRCTAKK